MESLETVVFSSQGTLKVHTNRVCCGVPRTVVTKIPDGYPVFASDHLGGVNLMESHRAIVEQMRGT